MKSLFLAVIMITLNYANISNIKNKKFTNPKALFKKFLDKTGGSTVFNKLQGIFKKKDDIEDIENCNDKKGTSVFKIHVHVDELAMPLFSASVSLLKFGVYTPQTAVEIFFGEIFDEINKIMQPYGIQVHGDFSKLPILPFQLLYDREKCIETNPAETRTLIATTTLGILMPDEIGNKLFVFLCPNNPNSDSYGSSRIGECQNIGGYLFGPLPQLKKKVLDTFYSIYFRNEYKDTFGVNSEFNKNVCGVVDNCIKKGTKNIIGEYVPDLKSVRHVFDEKYLLNDSDRVEEHDLYDDVYVDKYVKK